MAESKTGRAISNGVVDGVEYGLLGAIAGPIAAVGIVVGLAAVALALPVAVGYGVASLVGGASIGFGAGLVGVAAGLVTAAISIPTAAATGLAGGVLGVASGIRRGGREANEIKLNTARELAAAQTYQGMGNQLMAEMQAAQSAPNPYHKASGMVDAATVQHEAARMNEVAAVAGR